MVQLRVVQEAADDLDFDLEGTWDEVRQAQVAPEEDLEDLEEGDVFAMEDRKDLAEPWPGRKVFVGMGDGDDVWIFDEHGEPSPTNAYLFNGDIADRGSHALDIFLLLLTSCGLWYYFANRQPQKIMFPRHPKEISNV